MYLVMHTILYWSNNNRAVGKLGDARLASPLSLLVSLCYSPPSFLFFIVLCNMFRHLRSNVECEHLALVQYAQTKKHL